MIKTLSFDDVLLTPQYSNIKTRAEVNTETDLGKGIILQLPLISSPMDTISEQDMATTMRRAGGIAVVHRYNTIQRQVEIVSDVIKGTYPSNIGAAIGASADYLERADALYSAGVNLLCIDIAHGHHALMESALTTLKNKYNDSIHIMAGNVATLEGFNALADWGADSIRVGIGGGSICSTRLQTGHGVSTFQSVLDCATSDRDAKLIADGGIRNSGDIVKALAAGADAVMVGSLLAGSSDTPGAIHCAKDGKEYKLYRGMASKNAQLDWRGKSSSPEGISTTIPYKGETEVVLRDIHGGIKSGFSYSGSRNLLELRTKCQFNEQTSAGQSESFTHILRRG